MNLIRAGLIGALASCLALLASGAQAAEAPAEDLFDRLGIALELEGQCNAVRGMEGWYMRKAWVAARPGSRVDGEIQAANRKAGFGNIFASAKAETDILKAAVDQYRTKAFALGCAGGTPYLRDGRTAATLELGATLYLANATRGQAPAKFDLPELNQEQRGLMAMFFQAFRKEATVNAAALEERMMAMAAPELQRLTQLGPIVAKPILQISHDEAFAILRAEALAAAGGYSAHLVTHSIARPMDAAALEWRKQGSRKLRLQGLPRRLWLAEDGPLKWHSYAVLALREDSSAVLGLFGEDTTAIADRLRAAILVSGSGVPELQTSKSDCPFTVCFTIPAKLVAEAVPNTSSIMVTLSSAPFAYAARENVIEIDRGLLAVELEK